MEASRVSSVGQFLSEEMLGVGLIAVTVGLIKISRANRKLLTGMVVWVLPAIALPMLFKVEGQHDFWFVVAWLALWLAASIGLEALSGIVFRRAALVMLALGAIGIGWAIIINRPLLDQRGYDLAEVFGWMHLDPLEKDSVLIVLSDDATAVCRALQVVKGVRRDVRVIHETEIEREESGEPAFRLVRLLQTDPRLRPPELAPMRRRFPGVPATYPAVLAFLNANADSDVPIYLQREPFRPDLLRADFELMPCGAVFKLVRKPRGEAAPSFWNLPIDPRDVVGRFRRERGQAVFAAPDGIHVRSQSYEERLLYALLKAQRAHADELFRRGTTEADA